MKTSLTEIDKENWRFVLYESENGEWFGDFTYSPSSFVDLSLLIELTNLEKVQAKNNRQFLIDISDKIQNNFTSYVSRGLNRNDYTFNNIPFCNFEPGQSGYKNLTCEKWTLTKETVLEKEEAIGYHKKIKTFQCFKCNRYWKIFEEFDSHHGYNYIALKEGETATIWCKIQSFESKE